MYLYFPPLSTSSSPGYKPACSVRLIGLGVFVCVFCGISVQEKKEKWIEKERKDDSGVQVVTDVQKEKTKEIDTSDKLDIAGGYWRVCVCQ